MGVQNKLPSSREGTLESDCPNRTYASTIINPEYQNIQFAKYQRDKIPLSPNPTLSHFLKCFF